MERYTQMVNGEYHVAGDSLKEPVEIFGENQDGARVRVLLKPTSFSGEAVTKLGRYEDIHPDPEYVREIFERYMDLCK